MAAPQVNVSRGSLPPSRTFPTDTGMLFASGLTDRGGWAQLAKQPLLVTSLAAFVSAFGARQSYSVLYDALDTFFQEGGSRAYIGRVVGPAAAKGAKNLLDGSAGISLIATAKSEGAWSSSVSVAVTNNGATYNIVVTDTSQSPAYVEAPSAFTTLADAVSWSASSQLVDLALGASSNLPATAVAGALSAGTDDRASITDTHWQQTLDRFTRDLGPGQVCYPGRTTVAAHAQLEAHAEANGRVALLDLPDSGTATSLTSVTATDRGVTGARASAAFAPWLQIPGLPATPSAYRTVPPSTFVAGIMARNDGNGLSPNVASAGDAGQAIFATGLSQAGWDSATRGSLNDAGVNVIRQLFGGVRVYGARTLADPNSDANWKWLPNARLFSAIYADGYKIGQDYAFAQIDGNGHTLGQFQGDLVGMLLGWYKLGSLYGSTPDEAFSVDISANTPATEAGGELIATMNVRMSPLAEDVEEIITKVPITQALP